MDTITEWTLNLLIFLAAIFFAAAIASIFIGNPQEDRLMKECMKDLKEYECYSIIKKDMRTNRTHTVPVGGVR